MMHLKIFTFLIATITSFFCLSEHSDVGELNKEIKVINALETNDIVLNEQYNEEDHENIETELINNIYKEVSKEYSHIDKEKIEEAFKAARNRLVEKDKHTYEEYYTLVELILTVMEIESGYRDIVSHNKNGTSDYGIMQINDATINEINTDKELNIKHCMKDNIEAGSIIIYDCYRKATLKHPNNILWYTYAYYNRGLYFENYRYNYNQANTRSNIFIDKYYKYHNIIRGALNEQQ